MNATKKLKLDYWTAFNEYFFEDKAYSKVLRGENLPQTIGIL